MWAREVNVRVASANSKAIRLRAVAHADSGAASGSDRSPCDLLLHQRVRNTLEQLGSLLPTLHKTSACYTDIPKHTRFDAQAPALSNGQHLDVAQTLLERARMKFLSPQIIGGRIGFSSGRVA
eukprot:695624-Pyramimonas_sp.AAC.3